jgi:hypothetical protein
MVSAGSVMSLKFWLSTEIWIDVGPPRPLANELDDLPPHALSAVTRSIGTATAPRFM